MHDFLAQNLRLVLSRKRLKTQSRNNKQGRKTCMQIISISEMNEKDKKINKKAKI